MFRASTPVDLDDAVEVTLLVDAARLDLTLHHIVVRRVNVIVQRGLNLADLEWSQESVIDAVLERIDENRIAEILVGVRIFLPPWSGGEAELNGGGKILHDPAPVAFVVCSSAMAFVNDDEIEEVGRIVSEIG